MKRFSLLHSALLAAMIASVTCGCLSIGGKVVHENPETESRLDSLESRVSNLERSLGTAR
jgi:hypothetical protein